VLTEVATGGILSRVKNVVQTWTLNTQQANKLLATEMDFWRRSARKSRKEKVRNVTIREIMEVGKNILELTE
jgi:hypothetical protein